MPTVPTGRRFAAGLASLSFCVASVLGGCGNPEPEPAAKSQAPVDAPMAAPKKIAAVEAAEAEATTPRTVTPAAKLAEATATRSAAPAVAVVTGTPRPAPQIALSLDATEIEAGACTTLRWSVANAVLVAMDGQPIADSGAREVCPQESATYTLNITPFSGYDEQRWVSLTVRQAGAAPGEDREEDAPPPPMPSPTPCEEEECLVTPAPEDDPFAPLPTLPPAEPPAEPTSAPPPPAEPTSPPEPEPPPEPSEPPPPPDPAPAP
jgi:hypothetical protein